MRVGGWVGGGGIQREGGSERSMYVEGFDGRAQVISPPTVITVWKPLIIDYELLRIVAFESPTRTGCSLSHKDEGEISSTLLSIQVFTASGL